MKSLFKLLATFAGLGAILACSLGLPTTPSTPTPTAAPASPLSVSYNNVSFIIPDGLATNALVGTVPALTGEQNWSPWDIAPEHIKILLDNYAQAYSFHTAEILIYPAQEYAAVSGTSAGEDLRRLQAIVSKAAPLAAENMPSVPFFNAGQVIAAQMQIVPFQDGSGVRLVTQYDSGITPISNAGLFYHFQGLTSDGKYYIIAILPTWTAFLPADNTQYTIDAPTVLDFPGYYKPGASGDDFNAYFKAVTEKLSASDPSSFTPSLATLDQLIQSIRVNP